MASNSSLLSKNMVTRSLSGVVLVAAVVGSIWFSPYTMLLLLAVICVGAMGEFNKMARTGGAEPMRVYPTIVGVAMITMSLMVSTLIVPVRFAALILPAVFAIFAIELFRKKESPFTNIVWAVGGLVYIAVPLALIPLISIVVPGAVEGAVEYMPQTILGVVAIVWANDIFAYVFGLLLGRHKIFERISPKKTWEGFFAGVLCSMAVSVAVAKVVGNPLGVWIGAAAVVALSAVLGDFVESMLKRSVGVKDSGAAIPGHGGFLDRFDALIFALPFAFAYFVICA